MEVEQIRILPTNGREISFDGKLIAQASSEQESSDDGVRWFDLKVYELADGGFVPVIEFQTTYANEEQVIIAEKVDTANDVESFFFVFEPYEVLGDEVLNSLKAEQRQIMTKSLLKLYDCQVNRVLLTIKQSASEKNKEFSGSKKL